MNDSEEVAIVNSPIICRGYRKVYILVQMRGALCPESVEYTYCREALEHL
jgi:hypothetical protein